jgi:PAS domain-containing protein
MFNRVTYGDDILAQAKSLTIKALYIKWKTLSQLKRLTLTDFLDNDDQVSRNALVMLNIGDDYAVIYHGAEHRKALGYDLSGKLISQADTRVSREMREIYDQVCEIGIPVRFIYASDAAKAAVGWERIVLPLKVGGDVRILVTYSEALNSVGDVHNFLFENSPHMLIVALPIATYGEQIVDADIIQINPAAAQFFQIGRFTELPIRLRQLSPWFDDEDTWRVLTANTDTAEREHVLAGTGADQMYKCAIVKLDHLLVFRIYMIEAPQLVAIG